MYRYLLLFGFTMLFACNQDTIIGSGLISDQVVDIAYTDTVSVSAKPILGDSLIIFAVGDVVSTNLSISLMGELNDPYFGKSETAAFFDIGLSSADTLNWADAMIDSAILIVPLDTISTYGDSTAIHNFELFELNESMMDRDTFRTDDWLDYNTMAVGSRSFVPDPRDSLLVYNPDVDSSELIRPHIRIPLTDQSYIESLVDQAHMLDDDTLFREQINGFALRSFTDVNSIVTLNFANEFSALRELSVYYTRSNGDKGIYSFPIGARRSIAFRHDYTGTSVNESLTDQTVADSILFIQSMQGVNLEVDLSALRQFDPGTINYAALEFTVALLPEDDLDLYPPIDRIGAFWEGEDGNVQDIDDLSIADDVIFFSEFFGGILDETGENIIYNLAITNHALDIINDNINTDKIVLIPFNKQFFANRSIVYGSKHSTYPMRLKLIKSN